MIPQAEASTPLLNAENTTLRRLFEGLLEALQRPAWLVSEQQVCACNKQATEWVTFRSMSTNGQSLIDLLNTESGLERRVVYADDASSYVLVLAPSETASAPLRVGQFAERHKLTPRQKEVLTYVVSGYSNAAIATALGVKENTVEVHIAGIFARTSLQSRVELVARVLG